MAVLCLYHLKALKLNTLQMLPFHNKISHWKQTAHPHLSVLNGMNMNGDPINFWPLR